MGGRRDLSKVFTRDKQNDCTIALCKDTYFDRCQQAKQKTKPTSPQKNSAKQEPECTAQSQNNDSDFLTPFVCGQVSDQI